MTENETLLQIKGAVTLVADALDHGSRAIERVHLATARRPFAILELFPIVRVPAAAVETVHNASVNASYEVFRITNRAVEKALTSVIQQWPTAEAPASAPPAEPTG
ncbi:MAG: hypothetical protein HOW73_23575 [Polyangiaceae bacterium]|nr:hypothetical protein [Polyangiaceae bacterium]